MIGVFKFKIWLPAACYENSFLWYIIGDSFPVYIPEPVFLWITFLNGDKGTA